MLIKNSQPCGKSELDLFSIPPTQIAVVSGVFDDVMPLANYTNTITFNITGDSKHYIDLSQTELWVKLSLEKNKTIVTDFTNIGVVNNLMHSIFSQVQILVNNVEVENSNSHYGYRCYLENLLCYGKEAKETFLATEGFSKDTAGNFEQFAQKVAVEVPENTSTGTAKIAAVTDTTLNKGLIARMKRFKDGKDGIIELKGPIHSHFLQSERYLLPNNHIQIKLTRANDNFYMLGSGSANVSVKVEECFLRVRRVVVNDAVIADHLKTLEETNASYIIKQVLMKSVAVPFSATSGYLSGVHTGIMPSRVLVGFIENTAFNGSLNLNPFNFQNFGINFIRLKVGSEVLPYANGLRFKYGDNRYLQAYSTLFQNIAHVANDITYEEYKDGYTIYAFDLTADNCNGPHFNELRDGSMDLEIVFDEVVKKPLMAVFYMEFDNSVQISNSIKSHLISKIRTSTTPAAAYISLTFYSEKMALYENVVEKILTLDEITKKIFLGAFARDELPDQPPYPSCFIVNTEFRSKSGGHWLALHYSSTGVCSFFDSYGNDATFYRLQAFIQRTSNIWLCNKKRIQGYSEYCGYYCVLFLLYKSRNLEAEFFKQFTNNYNFNDDLIKKLISEFDV